VSLCLGGYPFSFSALPDVGNQPLALNCAAIGAPVSDRANTAPWAPYSRSGPKRPNTTFGNNLFRRRFAWRKKFKRTQADRKRSIGRSAGLRPGELWALDFGPWSYFRFSKNPRSRPMTLDFGPWTWCPQRLPIRAPNFLGAVRLIYPHLSPFSLISGEFPCG
jgi:hypothetical protein